MSPAARKNGRVRPGIALAILEALRKVDTPEEALEDEAFHRSLPRRLGLSDVVSSQMRRYADLRDRGGAVEEGEFRDLLRLIGRRPDAHRVFAVAGRRLAEEHLDRPRGLTRLARRLYPEPLRRRLVLRCLGRAARALSPGRTLHRETRPLSMSVEDCLLASSVEAVSACEILTAAATVCVEHLWQNGGVAQHPSCVGRGDDRCIWTVEDHSG